MNRETYRLNKDIFVKRSNDIHGLKYDYSEVEYKNHRTKVKIICPIHGEFWQTPKRHMLGQGCPECGKRYAAEWRKNDYKTFIASSIERFGDRYEFPNIENEYENSHSKITIKCKKCGNEFVKIACDHITSPNGGCGHCYGGKSKPEEEIGEFIKLNVGEDAKISFNDRTILTGNEIDIVVEDKNIAFEYNGLYWHSNKSKNYHLMKTESCERKGIRLVQIFEDEYLKHKDIVLSKIKHILGNDYGLEKIYGRKCIVREISYKESREFLDNNHIQGHSKSTVYLGAFYNNMLIGVMTFTKNGEDKWELSRFATDIHKRSIGVAGKLFSYFVKKYKPNEVKSFADRRWTVDSETNLYNRLGFKLEKVLAPDYKYYLKGGDSRIHKFGFRKKILHKKYGLPLDLKESEMAKIIGASKIYDCGLYKYVWTKNR